MLLSDRVQLMIRCDLVGSEFNIELGNLLNRLHKIDLTDYNLLGSAEFCVDFTSTNEVDHACKCFTLIRHMAIRRKMVVRYSKSFYDSRLKLNPPYFGEYPYPGDSMRMLTRATQPMLDYNVFYFDFSLDIM